MEVTAPKNSLLNGAYKEYDLLGRSGIAGQEAAQVEGMENWGPAVALLPFIPFNQEDSGIDSEDEPINLPSLGDTPNGSSSSEDEIELERFRESIRRFCNSNKLPVAVSDDDECFTPKELLKQSFLSPGLSHSDMDRESPPLLEVELTASDEDDDGSVLELVIPMQQNMRYQRARNQRSKIGMDLFWRMFCCLMPRIK